MQKIHVFFDFDGTLADSDAYWRRLSVLAYTFLGYGVTEEQFLRGKSCWFLPHLAPTKKEVTDLIRKHETKIRRREGLEQKLITNFEDTTKALEFLFNNGCALYIVSDAPAWTGYMTVEKLMLGDYFNKIIFDARKPNLNGIQNISFNNNDELWVVGDAEPDRLFARNLGAKYINVDRTPNSRLNAAYTIIRDSFQEWLY